MKKHDNYGVSDEKTDQNDLKAEKYLNASCNQNPDISDLVYNRSNVEKVRLIIIEFISG